MSRATNSATAFTGSGSGATGSGLAAPSFASSSDVIPTVGMTPDGCLYVAGHGQQPTPAQRGAVPGWDRTNSNASRRYFGGPERSSAVFGRVATRGFTGPVGSAPNFARSHGVNPNRFAILSNLSEQIPAATSNWL